MSPTALPQGSTTFTMSRVSFPKQFVPEPTVQPQGSNTAALFRVSFRTVRPQTYCTVTRFTNFVPGDTVPPQGSNTVTLSLVSFQAERRRSYCAATRTPPQLLCCHKVPTLMLHYPQSRSKTVRPRSYCTATRFQHCCVIPSLIQNSSTLFPSSLSPNLLQCLKGPTLLLHYPESRSKQYDTSPNILQRCSNTSSK